MTNRQRALAVLNYQPYDRLPVVHFGFWYETLEKWYREGHLTHEEAYGWSDGNAVDRQISKKLGFDFNWYTTYDCSTGLFPGFSREVVETLPDGSRKVVNGDGMIILEKDNAGSIPMEIDHLLKDRQAWETLYLPKLQWSLDRIDTQYLQKLKEESETRDYPLGIHCGSLYGQIRNWLGVAGISYLYADDEDLYDEIIQTVGDLCCRAVEKTLEAGVSFDYGHFWEDICFKNGPLVNPQVFMEKVGPHYKRITDLLKKHDIGIVSLDCDGLIDSLIPIWFENGVNTMFPIEVGTWNASIAPWRSQYGKELRGVGGMDKKVFAYDKAAIDAEVERSKPLVELGGYIPCPDHRIAPDAEWENVQYYCDRMRKIFG